MGIHYETLDGKENSLLLSGFSARVVQHENDHLNGKLISEIGVPIEEKMAQ